MGKYTYPVTFEFKTPKAKIDAKATKAQAKALRNNIIQAHQAGMANVERMLGPALDAALDNSNWTWPRAVTWRDGTQRGAPRSITNTGALKASRKTIVNFLQTKAKLQITYSAPHANLVYYGGVIQPYGNQNAPSVLIPGRPWVEAILNGSHGQPKFDMAKAYDVGFKQAFNK